MAGALRTDCAVEAAAIPQLRDRLKSEDQNQKRPKTHQPRRIKRQENTHGRSRDETSHTENRTATINPTPKSRFRRCPLEEVWRRVAIIKNPFTFL
jgi:hypothetical protein